MGCTKCKKASKKKIKMSMKSSYIGGEHKGSSCNPRHYGRPAALYHFQDKDNYEVIRFYYKYMANGRGNKNPVQRACHPKRGHGKPNQGLPAVPHKLYQANEWTVSRDCYQKGTRTSNQYLGQTGYRPTKMVLPKLQTWFDFE